MGLSQWLYRPESDINVPWDKAVLFSFLFPASKNTWNTNSFLSSRNDNVNSEPQKLKSVLNNPFLTKDTNSQRPPLSPSHFTSFLNIIFNSFVVHTVRAVKVKVAQSCPTLLRPHGLYSPWNSAGQNTRVGRLSHSYGRVEWIYKFKLLVFWTHFCNSEFLKMRTWSLVHWSWYFSTKRVTQISSYNLHL